MTEHQDITHSAAPATEVRAPARRMRRLLLAALAVMLLASLGVPLAVWATLNSDAGTRWLLGQIPGVRFEDTRGSFLGERFEAARVVIALPTPTQRERALTLESVRIEAARVTHWGWTLDRWALQLASIEIGRIALPEAAQPATPLQAPHDLRLPLAITIERARIGEITGAALAGHPVRGVDAAARLVARYGENHQIELRALQWDQLRASASLTQPADPARALQLSATAQPTESAPAAAQGWTLRLQAAGPLQQLQTQAQLAGNDQALSAEARIQPFAPLPLDQLDARLRAVNLATLSSRLPRTALNGVLTVTLTQPGQQQPGAAIALQLKADLQNTAPARWDTGGLPVRALQLVAQGDTDGRHWTAERADLRLGSDQGKTPGDGGQLRLTGKLAPEELSLNAQLQNLRPALLDARAPDATLSGPINVVLKQPFAVDRLQGRMDGRLEGSLRGLTGPSVRLNLQAEGSAQDLTLRTLEARAGEALLVASGHWSRQTGGREQAQVQLALERFDPRLWWPGLAPASAGPTRLNGEARADLSWPQGAGLARMLADLRGEAVARLKDSQLLGLPAELSLQLSPAGGVTPASAELQLAGTQLNVRGQIPATLGSSAATGQPIDWRGFAAEGTLRTADLARLQPLIDALGLRERLPAGGSGTVAGALNASLRTEVSPQGRLQLAGEAQTGSLRLGGLSLRESQARWRVSEALSEPLSLSLTASEARLGDDTLRSAELELTGSGAQHSGQLRAQARIDGKHELSLQTTLTGRLSAEPGKNRVQDAQRWQLGLRDLSVRDRPAPAAGILAAQELQLELLRGRAPAERAWTVRALPGRLLALGAPLRWDVLSWESGSAAQPPRIQTDAQLEPLALVPLLNALQPDFGWAGDLRVRGQLSLALDKALRLQAVLERVDGDLRVVDADSGESTALGLTALRLAVEARDGQWTIRPEVVGSRTGQLSGQMGLRADPAALHPPMDAAMSGELRAQVADLGVWGSFVPPGWRVGGALRGVVGLGGALNNPQLSGTIEGSGLRIRNLLEGINLSDGKARLVLEGAAVRLESFEARGGDPADPRVDGGTVQASGSASLSLKPVAAGRVVAQRLRVLNRVDRKLAMSGALEMYFFQRELKVDGKLAVDEALFDVSKGDAPTLPDDVVVRRPQAEAAARAAAAQAQAEREAVTGRVGPRREPLRATVAVELNLGNQLRVRGYGVDTRLAGVLNLSAQQGPLRATGVVSAVDGRYAAYGQKLEIDRGAISFVGPLDNPRLDIRALRPDIDMKVGVTVTGTAQNPRIRLFSDPEMPDTDKLSWLILGRGSDGLERTDTALLQRAVVALLAAQGGGPESASLANFVGLDELSLRQTDGEVRETIVSVGKQLSRRWYVGYERSVNAALGTWQIVYRVAQRVTVRARSGVENAIDLIWVLRWQ
ncbi:MAG TPA: translocation/assembly module TamB domain-containing protein [Burkholderiaceae bacterium]|nr:translocation/assembly module TamB domain-containing protein [Burkholderiaceae bacterium]